MSWYKDSTNRSQALGTIRFRLMIEDMMTYVTFHVIDAITSTNVCYFGSLAAWAQSSALYMASVF